MFRVEFFCKDPKLAHVLRSLDGVAYELKVVPVKEGQGGPVGQLSMAEQVRVAIAQEGGKFTAVDIGKRVGTSPQNVRSAIVPLINDGSVRKLARGVYSYKGPKA